MATALILMDSKQKQQLAHRAKLRGKSFSQEVRNAVEMYLDVPVEDETKLRPGKSRKSSGGPHDQESG